MRKLFLLMVGSIMGAVIALAPQTAFAQGSTWAGTSLAQMVEAARWSFGLLRVNAAFTLTNAGYDSDIYYGYLDEAVPDYTLAAGVPIQILLPVSKKVVLDLVDTPQYVFYLDTERERAWNNVFQGRVHVAMERFYIQAGGGLSNTRRRLSPELNVNIREMANNLGGLVLWQASRVTSIAAIYGGTDYDYGDSEFGTISIAEQLNRREDLFDLVTYVQPNPRVRFFLNGQYGAYTFKEETATARDAQSYGVFGGFEFVPREGEMVPAARVQGRVSLGYLYFDIKDPEFEDGSGLAGAADLSVEILRRTTARGFFSRGFQFSVYSGAGYFLATSYGGGISRALSRRASLSYDVSFGRTSYPEEEGGGGIPTEFRNRFTTHTGSLNIQLARQLFVSLLGSFGRRVTGEDGVARSRNFIGLSLTYGYPPTGMSAPVIGMSR